MKWCKMKLKLLILAFVALPYLMAFADDLNLKYNKKYYECEDKWVIFKTTKSNEYFYGFVYIDESAGFSMRESAEFRTSYLGSINKCINEDSTIDFTFRLANNDAEFAIMPDDIRERLELPAIPECLNIYKSSKYTLRTLINKGFYYNLAGASKLALPFLEKAYGIDPHVKQLEFELGYAYNSLQQYDKALNILNDAIKYDSNNYYLYKEK